MILARLDLGGPPTEPANSPHRPGQRLLCPHFHAYTENFETGLPTRQPMFTGSNLRDPGNGLFCLEDFLRYCAVRPLPQFQQTI